MGMGGEQESFTGGGEAVRSRASNAVVRLEVERKRPRHVRAGFDGSSASRRAEESAWRRRLRSGRDARSPILARADRPPISGRPVLRSLAGIPSHGTPASWNGSGTAMSWSSTRTNECRKKKGERPCGSFDEAAD